MSPIWNLFNVFGRKEGEVEGNDKESVERVARECLKLKVDADLCRDCEPVPERKGWWSDCNEKSNH